MPHECKLKHKDKSALESELKLTGQNRLLVSAKNPLCFLYFKSETTILQERLRQIQLGYWYIIHPLSVFRYCYEAFLIPFYICMLLAKPLESGTALPLTGNIILYGLSWLDILITFFTGYIIPNTKIVELRPLKIAKNYFLGPYFIIDVLGSIPYQILVLINDSYLTATIFDIFCFLRVMRIVSLVVLIYRVFSLNGVRWTSNVKVICLFVVLMFTLHVGTCLQLAGNRLVHYDDTTHKYAVYWNEYVNLMFRTYAYLFGIGLPKREYNDIKDNYEYIIGIIFYIIGKILVIIAWIFIATAILSKKSLKIKYTQIVNQLEEYMNQKKVPKSLRQKLLTYYEFKYQRKFFKRDLVVNLLSSNLTKDIYLYTCKSIINSVSILQGLSLEQQFQVVKLLKPEIFLQNDVIVQAGVAGNSIFFLATGTVAVYTHSGKEICHLRDGSYFGEIGVIFKYDISIATIIAIETCHVYRLKKQDFNSTLLNYNQVRDKIIRNAENRMRRLTNAEISYRKMLFGKEFTADTENN